jgi:hypothetical protein
MKTPAVVKSSDEVRTAGWVFGTPVVVKGKTWFPLSELVVWPIVARVAGRERSYATRTTAG